MLKVLLQVQIVFAKSLLSKYVALNCSCLDLKIQVCLQFRHNQLLLKSRKTWRTWRGRVHSHTDEGKGCWKPSTEYVWEGMAWGAYRDAGSS